MKILGNIFQWIGILWIVYNFLFWFLPSLSSASGYISYYNPFIYLKSLLFTIINPITWGAILFIYLGDKLKGKK